MLDHLLSSHTLGSLQLKNRVVMAPLTRSRAEGNIPNEMMAAYYASRAGAGLIISEGTSPSFNGLGYPRIPGAFTPEMLHGWQQVTDAVHRQGGTIFLQLMHTGRVSHPDNLWTGGRVLAPSSVEMTETKMYVDGKGEQDIPLAQEMNLEDITFAVKEYAMAAKVAIDAGFDGVELHAANGYLLEQFIHPKTNLRTDQFGGTIENRLRFVRDVAEATVAAVGAERVGMRISPYGTFGELGAFPGILDTYRRLAEIAKKVGLVYLHLVDHESMGAPSVPEEMKTMLRETFPGSFILSGGYNAQHAERDLAAGKGDLVAFGRPFIANPDLVERFRQGAQLAIPDQSTFYTPGPEGYLTYPKITDQA
ncbi:N-ethylmaleimide reductase [Neolewinella maritima]|uniref:N-ethylmaleimide reductase n=1 Tax=Neolewinella maritima TaxID=1383882 RepID=A0ABN8F3E2_9BACT|nr:alkene reductase [Neolewinella maritima]CAH1001490.1 N-ethylmaleimide reductase [Neolewinella maritima]